MIVDRTPGVKIVLERRLLAKGLMRFITQCLVNQPQFKAFWGLCSIVITCSENVML